MEQCATSPLKDDGLLKTPLYDCHVALGAKMTPFAGWIMPVQYKGILHEHQVVREKVGIFDVSHMGRILVSGPDSERFLDYLSTNRIAGKAPGTATYTVFCHADGGCVDDAIVYRLDQEHFFVVVNAGNRTKDLEHLKKHVEGFNVDLESRYFNDGILAVQGPQALSVLEGIFPEVNQLASMHCMTVIYKGQAFPLSRTGYTGENGYELYPPLSLLVDLWNTILSAGASVGIEPIGLGARDTLRLEMGYALYGHELTDHIAPTESVASWTVKMTKPNFLGKEALQHRNKRSQYGVVLSEKGIPREGFPVHHLGKPIGLVTSGSFSPSLGAGIAIVMVEKPLEIGDLVSIAIRQHQVKATVVPLPFLVRGGKKM